jgi:drug/metabolite transporter (DMT)-like permease
VKTVAVLAVGWLLFDTAVTIKMAAGAACALCGMILYSSGFVFDKNAPSTDAVRDESSNARNA